MDSLHFEWDPAKAAANLRKHGVSFEEAETAFLDDHALILQGRLSKIWYRFQAQVEQ
jgi:uncharacterized DUF497 family protein